jgi:hypothetical protein
MLLGLRLVVFSLNSHPFFFVIICKALGGVNEPEILVLFYINFVEVLNIEGNSISELVVGNLLVVRQVKI